jgi:tubulin delta
MDKIRREVERCDRLGGFMPCLSLAGGTGSGVGAYLTECLRSEYPRSTIVNPVVWPYTSGEVIIQNYNFVLTLAKLYECSDALIIFENDQLHEICTRIMDAKKVGFDDLNGVIAHKLASVLQPAAKASTGGQANYLDEIVTELCANDYYKLLSLNNVPQLSQNSIEFGAFQWPGLVSYLNNINSFTK